MIEDMRAACVANMAQRWMKVDAFNHEFTRTPDTGLHLWL